MKNIQVYLAALPTSCEEARKRYEATLLKHFLHTGSELKDTFYGVMATTRNKECDRVCLEIFEGIYQQPDAFDAPQFVSSEERQATSSSEEGYKALAEGFLDDVATLVQQVSSHSKWGKLNQVRILGCTNLVLPVSIAINGRESKPLELAPGAVCVFEYLLEDKLEKPLRPINKRIIELQV